MGQELYVLRCFSCATFQSHIVKKTNKWECKVCGAKQSVKKVYGRGTGKDCRLHTQKLNSLNGQIEDSKLVHNINEQGCDATRGQSDCHVQPPLCSTEVKVGSSKSRKWASYINDDISDTNEENLPLQDEIECGNDIGINGESVLKRKRKHDKSHINHEYTDRLICPDLDNYSLSDFPDTSSHKIKKYDRTNVNEKYNEHKEINANKKVISPSFSKKEEATKPKVENKIDSKWGKYLVDKLKEEGSSLEQCENVDPMSMNSRCVNFNTIDNTCGSAMYSDCGSTDSERDRGFTYKTVDSMLKCSNQSSSFNNKLNSDVDCKQPNNSLNSKNSLQEHEKNLLEIQTPTDLLSFKTPSLTSMPVFEQNYNLDNSDVQLDF